MFVFWRQKQYRFRSIYVAPRPFYGLVVPQYLQEKITLFPFCVHFVSIHRHFWYYIDHQFVVWLCPYCHWISLTLLCLGRLWNEKRQRQSVIWRGNEQSAAWRRGVIHHVPLSINSIFDVRNVINHAPTKEKTLMRHENNKILCGFATHFFVVPSYFWKKCLPLHSK